MYNPMGRGAGQKQGAKGKEEVVCTLYITKSLIE